MNSILKIFFVVAFITCYAISTVVAQSFLSEFMVLDVTDYQELVDDETPEIVALIDLPFEKDSLLYIDFLIEKKEYNLALSILKNLPISEEKFEEPDYYQYLLTSVHFHLKDFTSSIRAARNYLTQHIYSEHFHQVYYFFSMGLSYLKQPLEMVFLMTDELFEQLIPDQRRDLTLILSKNALQLNQPVAAFYFISENGFFLKEDKPWVRNIIKSITNIEDLQELKNEIFDYELKNEMKLKEIQILIKQKNLSLAEEKIFESMTAEDEFDAKFYEQLQNLREYIDLTKKTIPYRIGIFLPFKTYPTYSNQIKQGLELGIHDFQETKIELVYKDSSLENKTVEEQVRELIETDHVIAIITLRSNISVITGQVSKEFKIPVISLSAIEGIGKDNPFLFRFYRNRRVEATSIANYAFDYLNARKFVVFYPFSASGLIKMEAFWNQIKLRGGKVVGVVKVLGSQVDFRAAFRRITGTYQFLSDVEKEYFELMLNKRDTTIVDFDAIYLPFSAQKIKEIQAYSKAYNAEKVWILAGNELNTSRNLILKELRNLRFADTYSSGSSAIALQSLIDKHWLFYNHLPNYRKPTAYTIYAYEAIQLLSDLLSNPENHTSLSLTHSLASIKGHQVLTGPIYSEQNGELKKEIKILRLYRGQTITVFQ